MKLLVAEDHEKLAQSIAEGLREEGYSVDLTLNGDEAAGMLAGTRYDCVILDIMLPGREGWTILKELRDRGDLAPVLCLTARDTPEDRVKGLNLGADDYLIKPFDWDELLARVRALIRRTHGQGSTLIRVGDLEINTLSKNGSARWNTDCAFGPRICPAALPGSFARDKSYRAPMCGSTCMTRKRSSPATSSMFTSDICETRSTSRLK
jgi:DNA-binding response OmpR family regulator